MNHIYQFKENNNNNKIFKLEIYSINHIQIMII